MAGYPPMSEAASSEEVAFTDGTGVGHGPGARKHQSTLLRLLARVLPPVAKTEKGGKYDGVLSTFEEYHAIYMGFLLAYAAPETRQQVIREMFLGYTGGRGARQAALADTPHVHDAIEEPAYASFGLMVGMTVRGAQLPDVVQAVM